VILTEDLLTALDGKRATITPEMSPPALVVEVVSKYLPFTPLAHCQGRVTGQERCCRGIGDRLWDYEASHTTDGDIQQKMGGNLHSFWLLMLSCCSSFGSLWSTVGPSGCCSNI
jgi:hypothetical protein